MSMPKKKLAKAQQQCVDELTAMADRIELLVDGPAMKAGQVSGWFPGFPYAEGQISTMLFIAAKQIRDALSAFDDCAEDGVHVELSP